MPLKFNLGFDKNEELKNVINALNGTDTTELTINGAVTMAGAISKASQVMIFNGFNAVSDWTFGADGTVRLAASNTAKIAICPLPGLKPGDIITGFKIYGQIESAGGAVTLDADLRRVLHVAADVTDASLGAITQVAVTADTDVESSKTLASQHTVAAEYGYYVKITGTTAGSTDIAVVSVELQITRTL